MASSFSKVVEQELQLYLKKRCHRRCFPVHVGRLFLLLADYYLNLFDNDDLTLLRIGFVSTNALTLDITRLTFYLLKVNNRKTINRFEIRSKLTIKTPELRQ